MTDSDTGGIVDAINAVHREVGTGELAGSEARTMLLRRRYAAPVADVWDACTDPERLSRWFLPVTGELRVGGRYQLEGNAGGEVLRCEPPHLLRVTWVFGEGPPSEVEVRLTAAGDSDTLFELEHVAVVDEGMWQQFGPGAGGVGWDIGLLNLGRHLNGDVVELEETWQHSAEAKEFMTRSSEAWGAAYAASGAAPDVVAAAVQATTAFFTGAGQ